MVTRAEFDPEGTEPTNEPPPPHNYFLRVKDLPKVPKCKVPKWNSAIKASNLPMSPGTYWMFLFFFSIQNNDFINLVKFLPSVPC